ncbi:MAG: methylated-DNA--[protein]-cysteine S-methyltransferase [Flavobacteriales bacterium]|nr:methylated-DNA--[protein]-cysteine S-methyltransferase [Flavobacteriales bacterium]
MKNDKTPELFTLRHVSVVEGPIGKLWLESDGEFITCVSFDALKGRHSKEPKVLTEARKQMDSYFRKKRKTFDLPVQRLGTRFQRMVWEVLDEIPFGKTRTYRMIGDRIGGKAIARTVGNACAHNPTPIIVPCHRVIASDGLLTGYVGGLWRKRWLLEHEGAIPKELFDV